MYRLIEAQKAEFTVVRMTGLLEVSRSGFYKWRDAQAAGPTPAQRRRAEIDTLVQGFHEDSDQVYGSPRILADLRAEGVRVSRKTVAASMRRQQLAGISPRRFTPITTVVDLDAHRPKDLVDRRFDQGELDKVWTSDITYLSTDEGWLYLCAVRDGCSRRVLGWAVEDHMRTDLVESALLMAITMRGVLPGQVIFHADRGTQYTSGQLARFARRHDVAQSVGRTGVCWDNAQAESFWSTLKSEFYHRYTWPTKRAARLATGDWIERIYNRRRRHSKLGMISPVDFENRHNQTAPAA
jgi:transposase InsO family protein